MKYGPLPALGEPVGRIRGGAGNNLPKPLGNVLPNRQLTELARDVPLDVRPQDLRPGPWDREAIHQLFDTLQFRVLRDRLYATLTSAEPEADEGFEVDLAMPGGEELAGWLAEHACVLETAAASQTSPARAAVA